jgi:signal transduction histidine kinase
MTKSKSRRGLDLGRLRLLLALLFTGLVVPAGILVWQAFSQLELDAVTRERLVAEDVARGIDRALVAAIAVENARPFIDYEFAPGPPAADGRVGLRSPLSVLEIRASFPGAIGYFQVDAEGLFSTPLLPADASTDDAGIGDTQLAERRAVAERLLAILSENGLVTQVSIDEASLGLGERRASAASPAMPDRAESAEGEDFVRAEQDRMFEESAAASAARGQARFDELVAADASAAQEIAVTGARLAADSPVVAEVSPKTEDASAETRAPLGRVRVAAFEGDLEPLRFSRLGTGHWLLFRNAWRDGERFVQGVLIDHDVFCASAIEARFASSTLAPASLLSLSLGDAQVAQFVQGSSSGASGTELLYAARLSPPLADLQLRFFTGNLPSSATFDVLVWTTVALLTVLVGGFFAMYRFGVQQLRLARQQRDFVSAVSHELKTPLTSIRMYGEMLKSGWATEEKKKAYYDYIFDEGERLSRLIDNVLQLARISESAASVEPEPMTVRNVVDLVRSKVSTQAERGGFLLGIEVDADVEGETISADPDALSQVFINLVDNAIKYAGDTDQRKILLAARHQAPDKVMFSVRDYGPGVPASDMKRLFELFYRPDNALTRSTSGTGIGLSLVHQLMKAMGGRVDVRNREPGAEFRLIFPRIRA